MNALGNGYELDLVRHRDTHRAYNTRLKTHLDNLYNDRLSPDNAIDLLKNVQNNVREQLDLGKSLSQIEFGQ